MSDDAGNTARKALALIRRNRQQILDHIREREMQTYAGNAVHCVICKHSFSRFAPYHAWHVMPPVGPEKEPVLECRSNEAIARCPNCGSQERQRLLWKYLHDATDIFRSGGIRLLEIAPDKYFYHAFSNQEGIAYYPCDLNPDQDKYIREKMSVRREDATRLQLEDDYFDVILCNHVLEHIPDEERALQELYRVMKPGGWGIFQVPLDPDRALTWEDPEIHEPWARQQAYGQHDHVRLYGRDYPMRLERHGFTVILDTFVMQMTEADRLRYGLDPREVIYRCSK